MNYKKLAIKMNKTFKNKNIVTKKGPRSATSMIRSRKFKVM